MADVKLSNSAFVEFVDNGRVVERLGPSGGGGPIPAGSGYNPAADGTLPTKYWAANKGTELHWFQGACAHAKWDFESPCTEAEYDAAVEAAKGITISEQAVHPAAKFSSVVIDRSGTAHKVAAPPMVAPIPPAPEPK